MMFLPDAYDAIPFFINGGSAADDCGLDLTTFSSYDSSGVGRCPEVVFRFYTIQDSCGNVGNCVQTFTFQDVTPPTISCLGDTTLNCLVDLPWGNY